jgi:hypothetical protein
LKKLLQAQPYDGIDAEDSSYINGNNNLLTVYPEVNRSEITNSDPCLKLLIIKYRSGEKPESKRFARRNMQFFHSVWNRAPVVYDAKLKSLPNESRI